MKEGSVLPTRNPDFSKDRHMRSDGPTHRAAGVSQTPRDTKERRDSKIASSQTQAPIATETSSCDARQQELRGAPPHLEPLPENVSAPVSTAQGRRSVPLGKVQNASRTTHSILHGTRNPASAATQASQTQNTKQSQGNPNDTQFGSGLRGDAVQKSNVHKDSILRKGVPPTAMHTGRRLSAQKRESIRMLTLMEKMVLLLEQIATPVNASEKSLKMKVLMQYC